jgi:hypothetical protein
LPRQKTTPFAAPSSISNSLACAPETTVRLGRFAAGRRNAFAVFHRTPRFWFTLK